MESGPLHLVSKISAHSRRNPGKVAISHGREFITYFQLHRESGKIAHFLHDKVKDPKYVLIMLERSPELIISILGILRCGLIFVPIDPHYPENRIQTLFNEVKARWLITTNEYKEKFKDIIAAEKLNVLLVDEGAKEWDSGDITFDDIYNKHCYIYFTSGSTGTPKGVLGRHRSLLHYIDWEIKEFAIDEHFKVSQLTNPSFDPFLRDIFVPLAAGGTCCIPGNRETLLEPARLIKWLDNQRVNLIHIVPSLFKALSRNIENADCLFYVKYILMAGELVRGNDIKKFIRVFGDRVQLVNICGPTETTLAKLFYRVKPADVDRPIIPVGRPIADTQVMVLDSAGKKCLAQNVGEVYIRTPFISSGYFNDRELTKQVFIKNPFSDDNRDIVYKTGDLGRITLDGNLELVGRKDSQVKIRGVRVELGEIEDLLLRYDGISEAVVLADEDDDGTKFLAAYLVAERDITVNNLRMYLAKYLAEAMIPSHFMRVEKIPLNPNGKVDREALKTAKNERLELETTFVAPGTGPAKIIADAWREVLKVDKIGIHDNFFDLGANSMHLIRVNSRLKETLKRDIPVVVLLANPTISELTRYLKEGEQKIETGKSTAGRQSRRDKKDGIAVIGMAGRFPGAENIETFWENLKNGVESISYFSDQELEEEGIAPALLKNPNYIKAKGVIKDFAYFDASFFDYSPREAEIMDPQLRLLHECAWAALEDAGYNPDAYDGSIGFYSGAASNIYWMKRFFAREGDFSEADRFQVYTLNSTSAYGTRISYKLDLRGPSFPVHTGCSTSLVTIHLACQGLLNGECDMALAGGVSLSFPPRSGYLYQDGMIHSPDGHCRAFDGLARGTVFGDAVGLVVLKPLQAALADGDTLHAVIKGSAINNDGKRRLGYTAPSTQGQADVIGNALEAAGIEPGSIGYIETHGTGTALGDPNEIQALIQAFDTDKKKSCRIATIKTNMGHLNVAAGVTGFIKTVLCIKNRLIPPNVHFKTPNTEIDFGHSPFIVNTVLTPWEKPGNNQPRRAGVSSFGIGGTNAHVILEEAPTETRDLEGTRGLAPLPNTETPGEHQLIVLSAKTPSVLDRMTENLAGYFKNNPEINLADVAYTLQVGRKAFNRRKMFVCSTVDEAIAGLSGQESEKVHSHPVDEGEGDKKVVFMFPGQGSQYVNMGLELYQTEPVFREEMDRCFEILNGLLDYDIKEILYPLYRSNRSYTSNKSYKSHINQTEVAQPLLFAFEYALAKLLAAWGIKPHAMVGHSIGEYVAACLAGVFSLKDALSLVVLRGRSMQEMPPGSMLGVPLPEEQLTPFLNDEIALAAINGPTDCVVSGPSPAVDILAEQLAGKGIKTSPLHTSHAFHSSMMDPILPLFENKVKQIKLNKPRIPYISNLTGNWITVEEAVDPRYWSMHIRQTVRFHDGLKKLLAEDNSILIEVGPGRVLSAFAGKISAPMSNRSMVNLIRHPKEEAADKKYLLEKIGHLWQCGVSIDWSGFYHGEKPRRISLPAYPFERQRYWIEDQPSPGKTDTPRLKSSPGLQSSPGKKKDINQWFYIPTWKGAILPSKDSEETPAPSTWLVFIDECHWCDLVAGSLEKEGHDVITVKIGAKFSKENDDSYTINPQQREDYDILLQKLSSTGKIPGKIVHMWNITGNRQERMSGESVDRDQYLGFYSLLFLARAIGKQDFAAQCQVTVITDNMLEAAGEKWLCPGKATLLGPIRVIPHEYSQIDCRCIDMVLPEPGSWLERKHLNMLLQELLTDITEPLIAYRGNHRLVQTFEPVRLDMPKKTPMRLRQGGVYLITGGLGGIGLTIAKYLAEAVRAKLILVGRTALPVRQQWESWLAQHEDDDKIGRNIRKVLELEKLGSEVFPAAADVSDPGQMQKVIAEAKERFGTVHGVIHAAGLPGGGVIQRKTRETVQPVLAPKVQGTLILDRLLQDVPLDFFILFSSRRSIIGVFGQVDYSAANNFLDAFAYDKVSRDGTFCVSINWDSWTTVGMAHRNEMELAGRLDISLQDSDSDGILPAEGIDAFTRILERDFLQVVVSTRDFVELVEQHRGKKSPGVVEPPEKANLSKVTHSRPRQSGSFAAPGNQTEQLLVEIWKDFFGFDRIGIHDNFFDLGATSLDLLQLNSRLNKKLGREIPMEKMFTYPTIDALAKYLEQSREQLKDMADQEGEVRTDSLLKGKNRLKQRKRIVDV